MCGISREQGLRSDNLRLRDDCFCCCFLEAKFNPLISFFPPNFSHTHPLTRPVSWINLVLHDDSHKVSLQLQILTIAVSQNMVALSICLRGSCISSRDWGRERKWNQLAVGLEPIVQSWHLEKNKERKRNIWMQKHCKYFLKVFCLCSLFFLTGIFLKNPVLQNGLFILGRQGRVAVNVSDKHYFCDCSINICSYY